MALHYDFSKTNTEGWGDKDFALMNQFIWGTICVDLGSITEKNYAEWLFRMQFYDAVSQHSTKYFAGLDDEGKEKAFGLPELQKCSGLVVNVFSTTRKAWIKKVIDNLTRDIDRDVEYALKAEEVSS